MESTRSVSLPHHRLLSDSAYDEIVRRLEKLVHEALPEGATFAERERAVLDVANEVARRALESELQRIADGHTAEVTVRGHRYRRHERGCVRYHTLVGDVEVERFTYREVGVRNGPTIVPLDLAAGVFENATPQLARAVAEGIADLPSRRYLELMTAAHRRLPSRSTLERLAKAAGNCLKQDILVFEAFARAGETLPDGAHAIAIGLDRTTVPMAEERPPSAPPKRAAGRKTPYVRRPPPPFDVNYRMPYVGTVSIVDKNGEALVTRRYAATVEEGPEDLVFRVMSDARHYRSLDPKLELVVVQDGASELWGLMWDALRAEGIPQKKWNLVVDRFHVTEHMNAVLNELVRKDDEREQLLTRWRARLDKSDRTVLSFCKWAYKKAPCDSRLRKRIDAHHAYLESFAYRKYTRYKTFREKGFPTASGVTEGACKSLIMARCKRSGQRWQQDGLTAILTLRSTIQSERMPTIWPMLMKRFQQRVECAA